MKLIYTLKLFWKNIWGLNMNINEITQKMRILQKDFFDAFGVDDLWSNSKVYEILIASYLNHNLVPGHSGTRDARDTENEYEYKHYKELSSNHSWTFNDYSSTTINKMITENYNLVFAHINDQVFPPILDWYFLVSGREMGEYLKKYTKDIKNNRKMINISKNQIKERLNLKPIKVNKSHLSKYDKYLKKIFKLTSELEKITNVKNSLTSNKFWEIFIAFILDHQVNSEQGGRAGAHDAYDSLGRTYEYKVSKSNSWNFQDISDNVLEKYYEDYQIILSKVDKKNFKVIAIYKAFPEDTVPLLRNKLNEKKEKFNKEGKKINRLQVSLCMSDLKKINAKEVKL